MKTAFTLLLLSIISLTSLAQKNTWYAGGSAGFSTAQSKMTSPTYTSAGKSSSWSFSPEIGKFLSDHIQVGAGLTLSGGKGDNQNPGSPSTVKSNLYGGSLYARRFWGKEAFKPFAGIRTAVLTGNSISEVPLFLYESQQTLFSINLNAGFSYALSKRVTALGSFGFIGYESAVSKESNSNYRYKTSSFGFEANSLGDRFNIGFYFTLKKTKT